MSHLRLENSLGELRSVRVCTSTFDFEELFVEFPRLVSCLIFLILCPVSASNRSSPESCAAYVFV